MEDLKWINKKLLVKMRCKECDSNFRTINIPDDKDRVCYKCGFNNGTKQNEAEEEENIQADNQ